MEDFTPPPPTADCRKGAEPNGGRQLAAQVRRAVVGGGQRHGLHLEAALGVGLRVVLGTKRGEKSQTVQLLREKTDFLRLRFFRRPVYSGGGTQDEDLVDRKKQEKTTRQRLGFLGDRNQEKRRRLGFRRNK